MKGLILIVMLLSGTVYGASTVAFIEYTPGLDEGTNTLLPNSDWRLEVAPAFGVTCEDIAPGLVLHKTAMVDVKSYINKNVACNVATHIGFEDEVLAWTDNGFVQKEEFGNETIQCPIYGSCEMERVVSNSDKFHGRIELENGENGTPNGAVKVFATKIESISPIAQTSGTGGRAGVNNLNIIPNQTKYCVKVTDATSVDGTEENSKVPYAQVNIHKWLPFEVVGGGVNGVDANTANRVEIYYGLHPSTLHFLKQMYME